MEPELTTKLVGSHFRPPAKQLLANSPAGLPLRLRPEWDNPYDPNAIKVLLMVSDIPSTFDDLLSAGLDGTGFDLAELRASPEPLHLGYVAKTGGKPLLGTTLPGNVQFIAELGEDGGVWGDKAALATLSFDGDGQPMLSLNMSRLRQLKAEAEDEANGIGE